EKLQSAPSTSTAAPGSVLSIRATSSPAAMTISGVLRSSVASVSEQRLQRSIRRHCHNDVAAANQLALDEQLRKGRPARDRRQTFTDKVIRQHIDIGERCTGFFKRGNSGTGKPALGPIRRAFHV